MFSIDHEIKKKGKFLKDIRKTNAFKVTFKIK